MLHGRLAPGRYLVLAQSIDVEAETRIAEAEAVELERIAREHMRPEATH